MFSSNGRMKPLVWAELTEVQRYLLRIGLNRLPNVSCTQWFPLRSRFILENSSSLSSEEVENCFNTSSDGLRLKAAGKAGNNHIVELSPTETDFVINDRR